MNDAGCGHDPVSVLMVAIGGYGYHYTRTLLAEHVPGRARLAGVVDPEAERSRAWREVEALGVPVAKTIEEFYQLGHRADLAVVSSPIHFHVPQSVVALEHGSHVLCDKPLGATIQEAAALTEARDRFGRRVLIGYQWAFSDAILALKRDVLAGLLGRPRRLRALCLWPRDHGYYRRNGWAGRLKDPATGRWVLDGPANNAMAHYLHNLLFVVGPAIDSSAPPVSVEAELYRANRIESYDTVACRARTRDGAEVLFYASHATSQAVEPSFRLEFDEATVRFEGTRRSVIASGRSGVLREYGTPDDTAQFRKLSVAIDEARRATAAGPDEAAADGAVGRPCGIEAASVQTLVVNGMHDSVPEIVDVPTSAVRVEPGLDRTVAEGLGDALSDCYQRGLLPSEAGVPWAARGRLVDLRNYWWFPGGTREP